MANILGIPIFGRTFQGAIDEVIDTSGSSSRSNRLVSLTGAHGLVYAQKNPSFASVLKSFYLNLSDGKPNVWVGRHIKGAVDMEQVRGPSFFAAVMSQSSPKPIKHFLCGGKEGVADQLKVACARKFGNTQVVGTYCPPFREMTDSELVDLGAAINATGADVVWVGLSTPKQEIFAQRLARYTHVHFLICVGAAFDFHIGAVKEAPIFLQKIGMEWAFRLAMEPRRLYRRYAEIVPAFIYYNVRDLLQDLSKGEEKK